MRKILIDYGILLLILFFGFVFISNKRELPQNTSQEENQQQPVSTSTQVKIVDKQASFAIFTNGTFRVFTASMYHNLSADVYIEASNPNIVHVKKAGITWNDFFSTLPFKLTPECLTTGTKETFCANETKSLKFYLNSEKKQGVLDQVIQDGDSLLVTYGNESEEVLKKQIQKALEF